MIKVCFCVCLKSFIGLYTATGEQYKEYSLRWEIILLLEFKLHKERIVLGIPASNSVPTTSLRSKTNNKNHFCMHLF